MIDFNSGSGSIAPSTMPKARIITGEQLTAYIDAGLQRTRTEAPERDYIGASELGDPCLRRVYLNAINAPREPFTGQKLRIFEMGHVFEDMMVGWIKRAGFVLEEIDPDTHKQWEFVTGQGLIKGHSDGILRDGPPVEGLYLPALWENKALKAKGWKEIVKHGVRKAEPKYYAQVALYLAYFKLNYCLFTAINKDTAEIYHEVIPFQLELAQYYSDRGVKLIQALRGGFMPRRIAAERTNMHCRMCDRAEYCWSVAA